MNEKRAIQAVMFDLDGTLADTLADIAAAGNHMLAALGRETLPVAAYRFLAGQGTRRLVCAALGTDDEQQVAQGLEHYFAYYRAHPMDLAQLYDGVAAMLDALAGRGLKLAVLSNKPHELVVGLADHLLSRWSFVAMTGDGEDGPLKPDPARAIGFCKTTGVDPAQWAYVGDTRVDMLTGKAAGMLTIGVTWGFRDEAELVESGADAIIRHPRELMELVERCPVREGG